MDYKIVIDPSRGGEDIGLTYNGLEEKMFILKLANYINDRLKELGIKKLKVLYSKESPRHSDNEDKSVIGSVSFVPSVAGLIIASEVVKDLINI